MPGDCQRMKLRVAYNNWVLSYSYHSIYIYIYIYIYTYMKYQNYNLTINIQLINYKLKKANL